MPEFRTQRRLAAILAADVVGYSRLMQRDEAGTLAALKMRWRDVLSPEVAKHRGRVIKVMGDGVLVEFGSAIDAVDCAVALQAGFDRANQGLPGDLQIMLRIGINLGDVIVEGRDLYGDGVNLAARLEGIAEPGGICISANVHDQVRGKLNSGFDDLGPQVLKNFAEQLHVFRVRRRNPSVHGSEKTEAKPLPLPDKPSIAVLPFTDMSADSEQDHFVDGMTEDLITDLSRHPALFVIARNSTFAYKGRSIDVRQIARELGVRYLLEGSARRAAGRVRINVQLIDCLGGGHLWAERFDRDLDDIFAMQDEVTVRIVEALVGRLVEPPQRNRPKNIEAYDLCVRGRLLVTGTTGSLEAERESVFLLERAIALDPEYAEAYRWLSFNHWSLWAHCGEPEEAHREIAVSYARRAVTLDPNDAGNHWVYGYLLAYKHRWSDVDMHFARAVELDPNHADAWAALTDLEVMRGRPVHALEHIQKALRLEPHPLGWYLWELGLAQYANCQYEDAVRTLRHESTYRTGSRRILAASLAQLGRFDDAQHEASLFLKNNPRFTISAWADSQPFVDEASQRHFLDGYRKAGLPE